METTRTIRFGRPVPTVLVSTLVLATLYALALACLGRLLTPSPALSALAVIGGVLLTGVPVMLTARHEARLAGLRWQTYERMVLVGVIGSCLPIGIWQLIEAALRSI